MKNFFCFILILVIFTKCSPTTTQTQENATALDGLIQDFEQQLKSDLEDDNINGSISAAVVKDNKIIWSKALGLSDIQTNSKADTSTIYRIGSITKSFTAFLMMQLVDDGIIELDTPVASHLPEITGLNQYTDSTKITFQQLASHTSGLQREPDLTAAATGPIPNWEHKVLQAIPNTTLNLERSGVYSYSNIGYAILGLALSRAAKKPYIELIKERIFTPLGMTNSYFIVPSDKYHNLARGMDGGPFGAIDTATPQAEHLGRGYKVPNGAIYATPNDLAKFMIALMTSQSLLSDAVTTTMQEPIATSEEDWWQNYGLGLRLLRDNNISTAGHTGAVSGYTANFMFEKTQGYGVVMMRNYNWGMTNIDLRAFALLKRLSKTNPEE